MPHGLTHLLQNSLLGRPGEEPSSHRGPGGTPVVPRGGRGLRTGVREGPGS